MLKKILLTGFVVLLFGTFYSSVDANHSWGGYHWARTANPLSLKLGDNVTSAWDSYLATTSADWSASSVLDTTVVAGLSNPKTCKATLGRVEVCNSKYGNNGWLGIASIWLNGDHIVQGTTKLNDTYFSTAKYNTPAWKNLVTCQEVGHTFGLDHQDEVFNNVNLGTCMDYTNAPAGGVLNNFNYGASNEHPNQHDYDELVSIYSHLDSTTTASQNTTSKNYGNEIGDLRSDWGRAVGKDASGKDSVFEKDLGKGNKVVTHVFWAE